jgi:hypothetical protein
LSRLNSYPGRYSRRRGYVPLPEDAVVILALVCVVVLCVSAILLTRSSHKSFVPKFSFPAVVHAQPESIRDVCGSVTPATNSTLVLSPDRGSVYVTGVRISKNGSVPLPVTGTFRQKVCFEYVSPRAGNVDYVTARIGRYSERIKMMLRRVDPQVG